MRADRRGEIRHTLYKHTERGVKDHIHVRVAVHKGKLILHTVATHQQARTQPSVLPKLLHKLEGLLGVSSAGGGEDE